MGVSGSHQKWRHPLTGKQVIVAQHRGRMLPLGTMRAIIRGQRNTSFGMVEMSGLRLENSEGAPGLISQERTSWDQVAKKHISEFPRNAAK
jgi:hypothetical protein